MSKARIFEPSVPLFTVETIPSDNDQKMLFTVQVAKYLKDYTRRNPLEKFNSDGLTTTVDGSVLKVIVNPHTADFNKCDQLFRSLVASIMRPSLTLCDTDKIIQRYQHYLKQHNIESPHTPAVARFVSGRPTGSAY